jgi:hypothetical protein
LYVFEIFWSTTPVEVGVLVGYLWRVSFGQDHYAARKHIIYVCNSL